jgi:hypothetical protein
MHMDQSYTLLQTGNVAMWAYFTVAMGLIWSVATVPYVILAVGGFDVSGP